MRIYRKYLNAGMSEVYLHSIIYNYVITEIIVRKIFGGKK